jgi:hypothetical protein
MVGKVSFRRIGGKIVPIMTDGSVSKAASKVGRAVFRR